MRTMTTLTTKMRKRRRKTGSRLPLPVIAGLLLFAGLAAAENAKPQEDPYAVIAGTVFQESGHSLGGAEVSLNPDPTAKPKPKLKIRQMNTSGRGEFAFRVPPTPMTYTVRVRAPKFQPQEKVVTIRGDERVDVFLTLAPEKAK